MSKKAYEARLPDVRAALVRMQVELKSAKFPVILVVAGVEASGKGDVINILNGWLDPRGFETFAFHEPTDEERDRPAMWRYWRTLPANGRMAIYAGGWHADALHEDPRSARELVQFDATLRRFAWFEGQLAAGGALIVKVWLNLSKSAQRTRLRELESDPRTAWRVTPDDWKSQRDYDRLARISERMQPGVVYTTFHHGFTGANVVTTEFEDWATGCPEYKVTAVEVTLAKKMSEWQEHYLETRRQNTQILTGASGD